VKLTTELDRAPRLTMSGAIPLCAFMAWTGTTLSLPCFFYLLTGPVDKTVNRRSARCHEGKGKDKFHPITCLVSTEGSRDIDLLFFNLGARWGEWSTPRLGFFTPGNDPLPIV
jgi:hypothetical protein